MRVYLILVLCAALFAADPLPARIDPQAQLQFAVLQRDMEILRMRVCSDAGIKHAECRVDWQVGTVSKIEPPKPEPPKAPVKESK